MPEHHGRQAKPAREAGAGLTSASGERSRGGRSSEAPMRGRTGATLDVMPAGGMFLGPGAAASRDEVLRPLFDQLSDPGARSATASEALPGRAVEDVVPVPELRPLLLAAAAQIGSASCRARV